MLKAIKIRLYPNAEQEIYISKLLGSCRYVYNNCLAYKIARYDADKSNTSLGQLGKHLTSMKSDPKSEWLKESHSKVLQQTLINLEIAYKSFFKNGNGFPNFKSRKNRQSCRFPVDAIGKIKGNRINIIKPLADVHFKCSRRDERHLNEFQKGIKSATLSKNKVGHYYFAALLEVEKTAPPTKPNGQAGLDVGIKSFVTDSNGVEYENIKVVSKFRKKIAKLGRLHSRKKLGSKNRERARKKLAKLHLKLDNRKNDYLHKVSNKIIEENQLIVVEDLDIQGMMKTKSIARGLQDVNLGAFKTMLGYKADWNDRTLIQVDRWFPSSKLCSACGSKHDSLTLADRTWTCAVCKTTHDRDLNAAKNILAEGLKVGLSSPEFTLGETTPLGGSLNQEKNVVV